MSIFTSNAAAVNQGQSVITCTDNSDFSGVPSGSVVIINNDHLAVVDSGTAASSNNSTLTLRSPWPSDLPDITAGKLFVLAGAPAIAEAVKSTLTVSQTLTTTKQALQAIIDAQGTAATADLTNSATDSTAGRVYKVGDNVGIEYGSNANGFYAKLPDGTLICRVLSKISSATEVTAWTFPYPFSSQPTVTGTARSSTLENYSVNIFNSFTSATLGVDFNVSNSSLARASIGVGFTAIGRWK